MKNSTLGRKPGNDMKKDSGAYGINPRAKTTSQSGDGEDFAFNGQMGDGVNRSKTSSRYSGNPHGSAVKNPDSINHGLGPRKGNESSNPKGTPLTIATASQGGKINGGATAECPANYDKINVGSGPRKGNA